MRYSVWWQGCKNKQQGFSSTTSGAGNFTEANVAQSAPYWMTMAFTY
jgi:hypothetical protein